MSGSVDPSTTSEPNPDKGGLFDERPGLNVPDDPTSPESVSPDVIAPDLESPGSMPPARRLPFVSDTARLLLKA